MATISDLMRELKKQKLPSSKRTILKYERIGVISYPKNPNKYGSRTDRAYTESEIQSNIKKIKQHRYGIAHEGKRKGGRPTKAAALKKLTTQHGSTKKD